MVQSDLSEELWKVLKWDGVTMRGGGVWTCTWKET